MGYGDLEIQNVLANLGIRNASQELLTEIKQANPGSDSDVVHFLNENFNFLSGTDLIGRSCEQTVVQAAKQYVNTKTESQHKQEVNRASSDMVAAAASKITELKREIVDLKSTTQTKIEELKSNFTSSIEDLSEKFEALAVYKKALEKAFKPEQVERLIKVNKK